MVQSSFFRMQRMELLDDQIRDSALILINSEFSDLQRINFKRADKIINQELGETRIGKIFIMRNANDEVVFADGDADLLKKHIPREPQWVTVRTNHHIIRLLNLSLPSKPDRTLQVGAVVDPDFFSWIRMNRRAAPYIGAILAAVLTLSMVLTQVLLSPIRRLTGHLKDATRDLKNLKDVRQLPPGLLKWPRTLGGKTDDFATLLETIQRLIERINANYRLTRTWTFQMAHELKTPLTLIRGEVESLSKRQAIPDDSAKALMIEVDEIADTVTHFLDWADLENSSIQRDLHAVRVGTVVSDVQKRLERLYPGRLRLEIEGDALVLANPMHVDQLVSNLLVNALKFSPTDSSVVVRVTPASLQVRDSGPGIPQEVLDRLGQPFNVGPIHTRRMKKGTGLGLAWVNTVARLYHWALRIKSDGNGTSIEVAFPEEVVSTD